MDSNTNISSEKNINNEDIINEFRSLRSNSDKNNEKIIKELINIKEEISRLKLDFEEEYSERNANSEQLTPLVFGIGIFCLCLVYIIF
tara:strand:+ start:187 stop:450 length:264 start_codon:yes stop_codon:yes gene_type:complete